MGAGPGLRAAARCRVCAKPAPPLRWRRWLFRISLPPMVRIQLVEALADLEHRLAFGTSERLQLGALCACFVQAREAIAQAAQ